MTSVTVPLSESLDSVLKQTAASRGRLVESVVNTALSQYRAWKDFSGPKSAIRIGNIELDPVRRLVRKDSVLVRLTPTEFDLLHYVMLHAGLAMAHARILGAVWGLEHGGELEYLRTYIGTCGSGCKMIPRNPSTSSLTLVMAIALWTQPWTAKEGLIENRSRAPRWSGTTAGRSIRPNRTSLERETR